MAFKLHRVALAALGAVVVAGPAVAQFRSAKPPAAPAATVPVAAADSGRLWFVELAGAPTADGRAIAAVQAEKAGFRAAAQAAGVRFVERRAYDTLFNGFAVEVSPEQRAKLRRLPGVKAMYPVEVIAAPRTEASTSAPDLIAALALTGVDVAQNSLGLNGLGIKVGIIDTGVDYDHAAFGGSGAAGSTAFPSARVIAGYDFVGDNFNAGGSGSALIPVPDPNPDDCNGHGTHVAGIVGANGGGILGVAPQVTFGAYRVFGCTGSTTADIMLSALEMALADGMNVINQSIGAARQWPQYPTAQASSRLARKGVVMVASIGNNGPGGSSPDALFAAGAPGLGPDVIGVASFDNAQVSFTVGSTPYGFNPATGAAPTPTSGSLPMARTGTPASVDDACVELPAGSLAGQAALIRRGTCGFHVKALNAQNAGAAAVVLYNNTTGAISPTVAGTPPITIPVVAITQAQGIALDGLIAAGATSLTWGTAYVGFPYGSGGLISGFSSFGLAADLSLKPNIGAPGGAIRSAYPLENGGVATLSGTSMSAPHVAGAAALILQALPNAALGGGGAIKGVGALPGINMMTRMQNTANARAWAGNPDLGLLEHTHRQGAGMLDVVGAVQAKHFVTPAQVALGESESGPHKVMLTLRNTADEPVTFDLSHRSALATGPNTTSGATYNISGVYDAPAAVSLSTTTVSVPARGAVSFSATITANSSLVERGIYGGYIVATPQGGGKALSVPYSGFKGDYQSTVVLTPTTNGFPWLATQSGTTYTNCPSGCSFTMAGADIPYLVVHLDHQARRLLVEALDAGTGAVLGTVSDDEYVGRSSTPVAFSALAWDGVLGATPVPNGGYKLRISVLKALGDAANPAHWEHWTSPVLTVARP